MKNQHTKEFFEKQARSLGYKCYLRRKIRKHERILDEKRKERIARSIARMGNHESDLLDAVDREKIAKMNNEGFSVNEIADEIDTDLVTIAVILEGAI